MSASLASVSSLPVLVPCIALPAEGDDLALTRVRQGDVMGLLRALETAVGENAPTFVLKNAAVGWTGDIEGFADLQLVDVGADAVSGALELETRYAMTRMNWAAVMADTERAVAGEHFIATPAEVLREFATCVREAAREATAALAGDAVPLLAVEHSDAGEVTTVRFLGIWLAAEGAAGTLSATEPCILLDAEAEGRGLREVVMSAAMLAMVFQGTATAGEARQAVPQKASWLASLFGGGGGERLGRGEVLKVTSQKLVQAPPRIYRQVLDNAGAGRLKVVVDIADQRAYLVRGGQVAFETPISSAQSGRWTPRGTFSITEKVRSGKMSTIYHCPLPGWMRVGETAVGMHEGMLPGYPASHGCIRMPIEAAHFIFDHAPSGTTVQIVDQWSPPAEPPQGTMVAQN